MRRLVDGGMAVNDQRPMIVFAFQKGFADPCQVILGLILYRDLGSDPRMGEDSRTMTKPTRPGLKKAAMLRRNGLHGLGMNGCDRAVARVGHPIRGQRAGATYLWMQIGQIRAQAGILPEWIAQKAAKHPVVISLQDNPVFTGGNTGHQILDHAAAVGSAVYQIADMDDWGSPISLHIHSNQSVQADQLIKVAVNVANRIDGHISLHLVRRAKRRTKFVDLGIQERFSRPCLHARIRLSANIEGEAMELASIGLIGLGTMGAALALNIAEKGHRIAVWNRTGTVTTEFHGTAGVFADQIVPTDTLEALVAAIKPPRAIILMVPAGQAVDDQIAVLRPLMGKDDLIIDAGNANFQDTERRAATAQAKGLAYLGIGVSGGEDGARHGPSIMGGGPKEAWDRVAPLLQSIAAHHGDTPCATWMGPRGAGHFVKTVHNGIEYADMQMIAEVYGLMRDGMGSTSAQIASVFENWNGGVLRSYLVEISGVVARATDPATGAAMLDIILDAAGQKGTGRWTAIEAQHLAAPVPVIEAAVMARNVSSRLEERRAGQAAFGAGPQPLIAGSLTFADLEGAMIAGKILCYAQGFTMLDVASRTNGWGVPLPECAKVWRAGCIIRSDMLDHMAEALSEDPARNLILAPTFTALLKTQHGALRKVVAAAALAGHPMPALSAGLAWFDLMRTARGTANMIQAQRDFFGAHGFERIDGQPGKHGPWGAH
jgi:6-phosphogluconate dehydrogenase